MDIPQNYRQLHPVFIIDKPKPSFANFFGFPRKKILKSIKTRGKTCKNLKSIKVRDSHVQKLKRYKYKGGSHAKIK